MASHSSESHGVSWLFGLRFANMVSRILAILSLFLIIVEATDGAPAVASARQFLPAVPGYVPVYIRNGDTPLEEINPDLAEAFSSYSQKHARYTYVRSNNAIADKTETEVKDSLEVAPDVKDVTLEEDVKDVTLEEDVNDAREQIQASRSQHIQKIPRP